ncbi:MAG TPA: AEC family transporter [bacterium]|nr:AEC family transporter [bacterium]
MLFFYIAGNVILPIFLVMALGYAVSKHFNLDLPSLSKLNFYVFMPVFMFYSLLIFKPSTQDVAETVYFNLFLAVFSLLGMVGLTRALKFGDNLAAAATFGVLSFNAANYGIPVINLALRGNDAVQGEGIAIQVITITVLNVLNYTLGVLIVGGWREWQKGLVTMLKLPILYALLAAVLIRQFNWDLPEAFMTSLKWTADGMLSIALLTLGAQLAQGGITLQHPRELWISVGARLLAGPLLGLLLTYVLGLHGLLARVLFISSAFPTAVVTVIFGIEYKKEPTFSADLVFITTLLSAITVTAAISLSAVLF